MSESEQAQTIGKSEALHEWLTEDFRKSGAPFISENHAFELYRAHAELLEIVGSQAQKIADLNRVGSNTLLALIEAQEKIAEQAKEIERLKA